MTDTRETRVDDTARSRMEAMLAAMRRPVAGRDVASERADEERLAAAARQAIAGPLPDTDAGGPSTPAIEADETAGWGARLGRYLPIEELGRGGMGRVLRAYDPKLAREVALKVLGAETVDSSGWARMVREARSMAKLNHPHVVAVYDVVEDPRYGLVIAMELVEGTTLGQWLKQRSRPWREVLEAFIEAGRGLAAAHARGLLHRDFKPANVLVALGAREGARGPVKVTDFGLARRSREEPTTTEIVLASAEGRHRGVGGETLTEDGVLAGTPVYMAPEQHRGDTLTSAADQYAFCVALWEAVYGERPVGGSTLESITANVIEGRRRPPPKGRAVPNRLRRACERGLSLDPRHRWPSMEALLDELRTLVEPRTRRWVAAALVGGLAALGGGIGLGQYAEVMERCTGARAQLEGVWDEARKREVKAAIVGTERVYAPGTWERVEQRLDAYADAWADEHTQVCEATRVTEEQTEETMELRMGCLRASRTALAAAVKVLAAADAEVVEKAVGLAAGLPLLDRCDDVERLAEQRQRVPPPEDPQVAREVEGLRERLAEIKAEQKAGKYAQALAQVEPVVQRAEALGYAPLLAEAELRRGSLLGAAGKYAEAEQALEEAHALALEHDHDDVVLHAAQRLTFIVGDRQARHAEGIVWSQTALPLAERRDDDAERAASSSNLGSVLSGQGEYEQAELHHRRALQISEAVRGADHPDVAVSLTNLGNVLNYQGDYEQAELHLRRALQIREQALGPDHPEVAMSSNSLGNVFKHQGDYEQAELHYRRALRIREAALGADHPDVANSLNNLGNVYDDQGDYEQAELHHRRALRIREQALGVDHPEVAMSLHNLGNIATSRGDYAQAELHHRRALEVKEKALGADHPSVAVSANSLGNVFFSQGEYEPAKLHYRRALQIWEKALGADHRDVAMSLDNLGIVFLSQGDYEQAELHHQRALETREKVLGADHPDVATSSSNLGLVFFSQGQYEPARLHFHRALQIWEEALGTEHPRLLTALVGLAQVALAQEQFEPARAHAERAVAIGQASEVAPERLAEARFVLARALGSDRSQRARARSLAEQARDAFAELGDAQRDFLVEVEQWLAEHRAP